MGRGKSLWRSLWNGFLNWAAGEDRVADATLDSSAEEMKAGILRQRDAVAQAMALATKARNDLATELKENGLLKKAAKDFLSRGQEAEAVRMAERINESNDRLEQLTLQAESLKQAADSSIGQLKQNFEEVQGRLRKVNQLKALQEINALREQAQRTMDSFDMSSPVSRFDEIAGQIEDSSRKLDAKDQLGMPDGTAAVDARIDQALLEDRTRETLAGLRAQLEDQRGEIFDPNQVLGQGATDRARALLEAPAFDMLQTIRPRTTEPVSVVQELTRDKEE